ncbi:MAG: endonuclease/exonuclease/phosphatase family protein [Gemmatimonadaceae bacterium]
MCLIAVVLWGFGDRWWPATVLLFIGRWIFLLPLVVLIPAAALLRRALLVPLALSALIVAGPIVGFRTGWTSWLPHGSGMHFRVVTFNTDGGEQIAPLLPVLLTEWQPDVVAFQECGESLIEATRHVDGWYHHDVRALCLLSRYPIRGVSVMNRDALERVKEDEVAGIGGSGDVARYAIQTPRGTISFTNVHLETPRKGLEGLLGVFDVRRLEQNTELRNIESSLARRWVGSGESRIPLLVAGDFNTPVESRIFQEHWGDLTDAFSHTGFGLGMTKYNGWIRVRIDHVLSGNAWHADHTTVGPDLGSDHRPVIVDLTLGRSM